MNYVYVCVLMANNCRRPLRAGLALPVVNVNVYPAQLAPRCPTSLNSGSRSPISAVVLMIASYDCCLFRLADDLLGLGRCLAWYIYLP